MTEGRNLLQVLLTNFYPIKEALENNFSKKKISSFGRNDNVFSNIPTTSFIA
ncbi:hypothetical protein [uncultured Mucilaginibacter sp.]|uniref:hypothetical protein n=1 Tax=uncultured Mucilaginibacter sp. TaxID=797541 RepID=UPI00262EA64E|nr:hypothetical protein [uncultured Mucilaginibacter sp.]